ncbi:MAG TPA: DNA repair protein RadA [Dissulfurispiraceae bacterium]|nr:DNA repair protein RadA [Dissulfurispiraceae bacterium]
MSKIKTNFQCQTCGYSSPKWMGKCPDCGSWNSFSEERQMSKSLKSFSGGASGPMPLSSVTGGNERRLAIGISEFDRVLGGGLVEGVVILIGGDPGIGKSTIILQVISKIASQTGTVLYVSGEESPEQIKLRAQRLSIDSDRIMLLPETVVEHVLNTADKLKPVAIVIDSIQTVYTEEMSSAPGSVGQIRESAAKMMFYAKRSGTPVFLIGHVTKEGAIAGPRVLEHLVDTVLYFEGDRGQPFRILRTVKNRFGSTNEIGVFEMTDSGLEEITNPSEIFLSERPLNTSGSVVIASIEGTRPLLVELQALVSPTTFGMPRRTSMGIDFNRLNLLIAILEKKAGIQLGGMDVFINVVGGLKIVEPATDLGIIAAMVSSFRETAIPSQTFVFGEVGLSGEVRAVAQGEARIREAAKVGFKRAIVPAGNTDRLKEDFGLIISGVRNIDEAIEYIGI